MSYFGLNPVNQNQKLDQAASNPVGSPKTMLGFSMDQSAVPHQVFILALLQSLTSFCGLVLMPLYHPSLSLLMTIHRFVTRHLNTSPDRESLLHHRLNA